MKTYKQLEKRKEFDNIKAIAERLEEKDIRENNPNYNDLYYDFDKDGNLIYTTGWINKTYFSDIWYLFDLLDWIRENKI